MILMAAGVILALITPPLSGGTVLAAILIISGAIYRKA